jgi:hypothetical protein
VVPGGGLIEPPGGDYEASDVREDSGGQVLPFDLVLREHQRLLVGHRRLGGPVEPAEQLRPAGRQVRIVRQLEFSGRVRRAPRDPSYRSRAKPTATAQFRARTEEGHTVARTS